MNALFYYITNIICVVVTVIMKMAVTQVGLDSAMQHITGNVVSTCDDRAFTWIYWHLSEGIHAKLLDTWALWHIIWLTGWITSRSVFVPCCWCSHHRKQYAQVCAVPVLNADTLMAPWLLALKESHQSGDANPAVRELFNTSLQIVGHLGHDWYSTHQRTLLLSLFGHAAKQTSR